MKKIKYKVSFVNRDGTTGHHTLEFQHDKSAAAPYGNQTAVTIFYDNDFHGIIDTRYDNSVMHDFQKWCEEYLKNNLNPTLKPTWEIIKD